MKVAGLDREFIVIGENVHCTRIVLRKGKRVTTNPAGNEAVRYVARDGETRFLIIPEKAKKTQDYDEGRVKHVKIAVQAAMAGEEPAAGEGREYIATIVQRQVDAGANFLDLNVDEISISLDDQKAAIRWLVEFVEPLAPVPMSVDSSNIEIIEAGLAACRSQAGTPMLNSASLERVEALDVAQAGGHPVVATAAGESGMPENDEQRVANASRMVDAAVEKGIPLSKIYVDGLVFPISVDGDFCNHYFDAVRELRQKYGPEIHITGGFSNVSFGLPSRRLINDAFANLAVDAGADSGIVDPVTGKMNEVFSIDKTTARYKLAEDMLLGRDRFCKKFLRAYRKGELEPVKAN